jgi:hypothetical protein
MRPRTSKYVYTRYTVAVVEHQRPVLSFLDWTVAWLVLVSHDGIPSERRRRILSVIEGCFMLSMVVMSVHLALMLHNQTWFVFVA